MKRAFSRSHSCRVIVFALAGLAGCGYLGEATEFDPEELDSQPGWLAIRTVPFVLQRDKTDCGIAALTMVLNHCGIDVTADEVARDCPTIPEAGSRARDLRDAARRRGLNSFLIHGCWEDLVREIGLGHPVIVGLVKTDRSGARTHYEAVVAVHPELKSVVTIDPARGWCCNSWSGFSREWEPAGFLTLVCFRSDDPPSPQPQTGP